MITVEGTKREPVNISLVGVEYRALPPKFLAAIDFGAKLKMDSDNINEMTEEIRGWLSGIFGKKSGALIYDRLKDSSDDLDLADIFEGIKLMTQKQTGNPTT